MANSTHLTKPYNSIPLFLFAIGLWILLPGMLLAQAHSFSCGHACAHAKIGTHKTGIYEQDARLAHYDVKYYALNISLEPGTDYLEGDVRILTEIVSDAFYTWVIELKDDFQVSKVLWEGEEVGFSHQNHIISVHFDESLTPGQLYEWQVVYSGWPQTGGFFSGIQNGNNQYGEPVLWTLSQPTNARQWFPVKQVLEDKADSASVTITTPYPFVGASNGLLSEVETLDDGRRSFHWKTRYPIAYYLISLAVAEYQEYNFYTEEGNENSVWMQNFIYHQAQELTSQLQNLYNTRDMMVVMEDLYGAYPFASEKYGHAQAPMGGGMEHQTLSTMGHLGFDIVAHELAHQWFGNLVTCASWSDIWINEGFASYGEYLAREWVVSRDFAQEWMGNAHEFITSEPGGSVYVPFHELNDLWRIFNGRLTYRKGAAILHQLRFEINEDDTFFALLKAFQENFAHDVATGNDFMLFLNDFTGTDWNDFFQQWYYGEGHPIYQLKWWQDQDSVYIQSVQSGSSDVTPFFKGTVEVKLHLENGSQTIRWMQQQADQKFSFPINAMVKQLSFDPQGYMLAAHSITDSASLIERDYHSLRYGPNPFVGRLHLQYDTYWFYARWQLYDINGRLLREGKLPPLLETYLDFPELQHGIYFLDIVSSEASSKRVKLHKGW